MTRGLRSEWHRGKRRLNSTRIVRETATEVVAAGQPTALAMIDWGAVNACEVAALAPSVDAAMVELRRFQRRLRVLAATVNVTGEPCAHCGRPVQPSEAGRRVLYCSRSCRQRAYETRSNRVSAATS